MSADASTTAAAAATRVAVDVRRFPWVRPLAGEYASNFASVAPLYAGDPQSPDAWREVSARVRSHPAIAITWRRPSPRSSAAATPPKPHRPLPLSSPIPTPSPSSPASRPGVFGGPLYTVLKAVSAIQLARRAAQTLGTPVVPIFWVAAEDHDWEEIASVTVLDAQLQPRTITMPPPEGAGERPVGVARCSTNVSTGDARRAGGRAGADGVHALAARLAARRLPARRRRGRCVRALDRRTARQPRPRRVRLRRSRRSSRSCREVFRREIADSRAHGSARHQRRRRDGRARTFTAGRAAGRRPLALPHRSGDRSPHADQVSGRRVRGRRDHAQR